MKRRFILLPPLFYERFYNIEGNECYEIHSSERIDRVISWKQWSGVVENYIRSGLDVLILEPAPNLHELTFVGDAIFLFKDKAIVSRFYDESRQKEAQYMKAWAKRNGFDVIEIPEGMVFEGNAEAFYSYELDVIVMGYGVRTTLNSADFLEKHLDVEVIPVEKELFHLDVVMFPYKEHIFFVKGLVKEHSLYKLEDKGFKLHPLDIGDTRCNLALNCTYYENTIFMNDREISEEVAKRILEVLGSDVRIIYNPTSQFHIVGGGIKCLTLEHYLHDQASS